MTDDWDFYFLRVDDKPASIYVDLGAHGSAPNPKLRMRSFGGYQYEADSREEPDWSSYFSYLYPSDADRQTIENRRVCEALERNGDKLSEAREIDHWAYFPDAESLKAYVAEASQLGFEVRAISVPDESHQTYCAQLWRSDIPAFNAIDDVTLPLFDLAAKHGGEYDGWESIVVDA